MMKVLSEGEAKIYSETMDLIACSVFLESMKKVAELNDNNQNPLEFQKEIGIAMGQVVLDQVIDITEDMPKEALVRWFTEVAIAHLVGSMERHPSYKEHIMKKIGLI